jgi:hypothetical protein
MRMKNNIEKRLERMNAFLKSNKKPSLKIIHLLRLEVKHLEACLALMAIQEQVGARSEIQGRLERLFHEAGKLRKFGLEIKAIRAITHNNRLSRPTLFLKQLHFSKKKSGKKLSKKRRECPAFKPGDFANHLNADLSSYSCQQFLASRASSILDLLEQDIISDIRSLHQLRKILKSILYVLPICKKEVEPVRVLLRTHERFIKSVESRIGSLHDTHSFISSLEKKHNIISVPEQDTLKKIKRVWQNEMMNMIEDLRPQLIAIRQFALDLREQSMDELNTASALSN